MRYNSPATQLALLAATLLLTTAIRRLLDTYLLKAPPTDMNVSYDTYWPTSVISCIAGFAGIILVNLAGVRAILVFYAITNIIYASSIVVIYQYGQHTFHTVANIINGLGYDLGRVATLVMVLAYPSEHWKARALAIALILEYFAMTMGDIIALQGHSSDGTRSKAAIASLCLTSLAPFIAMAIAPAHKVVRNSGVYLIARKTTLKEEIRGTLKIFKNKYMLLMQPYMFSYPFLFGAANVPFPNIQSIILYDVGKLIVLLISQMLDIQWASRCTRGMLAHILTVTFVIVSVVFTCIVRNNKVDLSGIKPNWTDQQVLSYIMHQALTQYTVLMYLTYFFAGLASSSIELFGFWVMGTLTNDLKASARFVGTFNSIMSIGGLVGIELVAAISHKYTTSNIPTYIGGSITFVAFVFMYFVVRRITDTNDWTLGRMKKNSTDEEHDASSSAETIVVLRDIKHQQNGYPVMP